MMDGVETKSEGRLFRKRQLEDLEAEYKVPAKWAEGPIRDKFRSGTNKCCYLIFVMVLLSMIGTAIYAIQISNHREISTIYDSSGTRCGHGEAKGRPLLYLMTFTAPYKSVCVSKCPSFDYNEIRYNADGKHAPKPNTPESQLLGLVAFSKEHAGLSRTTNAKISPEEMFGYDDGWVNGYFTADQFKQYTERTKIDCLPNNEITSCAVDNKNMFAYDSYDILNLVCVPLQPKAALIFNKVSAKLGGGVVGDISEAMNLYIMSAIIALSASLIFLILVFCCTYLVTWALLLSMAATFIATGALIIYSYVHPQSMNHAFNALRIKFLQFLIDNRILMLTLSGISILCGLFTLFALCKFRKYFRVAIPILSYAAKTTLKNVLLIILSALTLAIQVGVFFVEIYILARIYTSGEIRHSTKQGSPFAYRNVDEPIFAMLVLHAFGAYWLLVTLNNFNDFVTAAITCNIYFRQHTTINNLNIFCHTLGHHVGSIAWSIILLPLMVFKLMFGWLDFLLTSNDPNCLQRFFRKLLCLCCWCYENLVDRFSESYFPVVYMGCENFWTANSRFYFLKEKYSDEYYTISLVGDLFSMVGKLLIAFLTTYFSFVYYQNSIELQQNIDYVGLMFGLAFGLGFFIGSLFINLFATTYDTIMVCYLIERNIQENYGTAQLKCPDEIVQALKEVQSENDRKYNRLA